MSASGSDDVAGGKRAESPQDFQRVLRSFGVEGGGYSYRSFVDRSFEPITVPPQVEKRLDQLEYEEKVEETGDSTPDADVAAQSAPQPEAEPVAFAPDEVKPAPVAAEVPAEPVAPAPAAPAPVASVPAVAATPAQPEPAAPVAAVPTIAPETPVQDIVPPPVPPVAEQVPPAAPDPASVPYANMMLPAAPAPVAPPAAQLRPDTTRMVEPFSRPPVRPARTAPAASRVSSFSTNSFPCPSVSPISGDPMDRDVVDEWSPVPKARLSPRERPRPGDLSFFFQGVRDVREERKFFPVASTRSVRSNVSKVTSMTKTDTNSTQTSQPGSPIPSPDGSPTMTEVFMTLGGRATEMLNPRPTLREALLRRRESEEGS
ncbi:hypothetical protein K6L44_08895 [Gluconacetobacter entanii]|uniref:hypothetical protein n=1 Tax=Gluconacetobacter entanii TaxID=108528 RepID=UPI001C932B5F|nr:hypothetical protein [Gluconacetobacter entanii]MBY4640100.1 hypothetical protein [Gluconacetobacter entanii]MCW4579774.1 hypothetical protein [Gluconacetobacter entanii]MCW4583162.1 hypothetical protein [Gluconacetobacter entanii]